jgi:plastocyanin
MSGVRVRCWSIALVSLIALSACGGGGGSDDPAADADAGTDTTVEATDTTAASGAPTTAVVADADATAQIMNYTFTVKGAVAAGTPLTITNKDKVAHTFSNPDGAFDVEVPAGGTADVTVATAGTYKVVCTIHSSMGAQVVVA